MDEIPIVGREDQQLFKQFQAQYAAPAYVRRARAVEDGWEDLLSRCRRQREEWLPLVRIRLGVLHGLAGDWDALAPLLADATQLHDLRRLHEELQPQLRSPVEPTGSHRALRGALRELAESIERFNGRWQTFLHKLDLAPLNELREGYNRFYLLEKECALGSARLARQGFRRLEPLTLESVVAVLPALPVPRWKE